MNDALEVLDELEKLINDKYDFELEWALHNFIAQQRSIYQPARGECAV